MGNKRAYIEYKVDGVLSDAYQVKLASEQGTYGIKTGSNIIVASDTSVLNSSVGVYEYTFDAENDKIYNLSWQIYQEINSEPIYILQNIGPFSDIQVNEDIQAVADYRGSFLQGKTTSLMLKITNFEGIAIDPESISISILNNENEEVESGIPEKITLGFYIYDWAIPSDQATGPYSVIWTYVSDGLSSTVLQEIVVVDDDTGGITDSSIYSERLAAMRTSLDYHLAQAQAIPIYDEEGVIGEDLKTIKFTFPRWNQNHRTRIYRNGKHVTNGAIINYFKGEVSFEDPLHPSLDRISADYNFRWFTDEELDRFMSNALHIYNAAPPSKNYYLQTIPDNYIPAILYGAAIDALRHLILDLQFQEPQEVFGGPELASRAASNLETLKKNYEHTFELLLGYKKLGPYTGLTRMVSVPEYTLPGGRSRWFRYMMGGFNMT